jgi:hypothetical protein
MNLMLFTHFSCNLVLLLVYLLLNLLDRFLLLLL